MLTEITLPSLTQLWHNLILPLLRLLMYLSVGLLIANVIEAFNWGRHLARLARPLARMAHLGSISAASFALAFFSSQASNALLAEGMEQGRLTRRELVLANLFNSSPAFLVHLPTLFSLAFSLLGARAFVYVGLTFSAALLRGALVGILGRCVLSPEGAVGAEESFQPGSSRKSLHEAWQLSVKRFKRRIRKLLLFTVPVYTVLFFIHEAGFFELAELWMRDNLSWLSFIRPEAFSIIALNLAAESGAAMAAAGALLNSSQIPANEIILALLIGNILSSPMRAFRHQLPAYTGYFPPGLAFELVFANQALRTVSLVIVSVLYAAFA